MKKLSASSYSYIAILVIVIVVIGLSLNMTYYLSKMLPLILSIAILITATIGLTKDILTRGRAEATVTEDKTSNGEETFGGMLGYLPGLAWVAGYILAIYLLGFLIATVLYVFSYTRMYSVRWLTSILLTIFTPLIIYFAFQVALQINLYPGLLLTWLER